MKTQSLSNPLHLTIPSYDPQMVVTKLHAPPQGSVSDLSRSRFRNPKRTWRKCNVETSSGIPEQIICHKNPANPTDTSKHGKVDAAYNGCEWLSARDDGALCSLTLLSGNPSRAMDPALWPTIAASLAPQRPRFAALRASFTVGFRSEDHFFMDVKTVPPLSKYFTGITAQGSTSQGIDVLLTGYYPIGISSKYRFVQVWFLLNVFKNIFLFRTHVSICWWISCCSVRLHCRVGIWCVG